MADIFEYFRKNCMVSHVLDPAWYYSMPGYIWDAMMKFTTCRLDILRDTDQIMFVEQGIRKGISVCVNRYSEANKKYMPTYDSTIPPNYLLYVDINNLYGKAMSELLPYGGFTWETNVENFDVMSVPDESSVGYILKVDLEYPRHLHDIHKDLPFASEHRTPSGSKLLPKLMTTLYSKEKYIVHYRHLKQILQHGLILKQIYKILKFKHSKWL